MNAKQPQTAKAGARPGAMTMAMQAVQVKPSGPKVLRIGLIQNGKIVEERIIRKRETVTVGSSEKNHFVVHTDGMPSRFELFQIVGGDYILNFTDAMTGRVGLPGGVQDLTQMREGGAARKAGDHYQVKLSDTSRGKVALGPVTLLFQFVVPPPVQPRPQLPAAAKAGLVRSIDWLFTSFVVFTFMSMFGFLVYLENADWEIEDTIDQVPDEVAKLIFEEPEPPPEVIEEPEETDEEGEAEEEVAEETPAKRPAKEPAKADPGPSAPGPGDAEQEAAVAEASARIAEEAAQAAEALIVGALSAEGGALADVLAGGAVTGNAEDILASAAGVGVATSGQGGSLRSRGGGGSGSGKTKGLGNLARAGSGTTKAAKEGGAVKERKVRGNIKMGSGGGDIGGAGDFDANLVVRQIKRRLSAIKACYERQLRNNPALAGKVTIEFTIQPRGNVTGVKVKQNTTNDDSVAACVKTTVSRFRFNPGPDGGSVTFAYPFVFAPRN